MSIDIDRLESAARDAEQKRRERRRKRRLQRLVAITLILAVVVGVTLSLTVFFEISEITVNGECVYNKEEVIAKSEINVSENLFLANTGAAKQKIERELPYIEEVAVRKKLPASIVIAVAPAHPVAAMQYDEGYFLISKKMKILETELVSPPEGLWVIKGFSQVRVVAGEYLKENSRSQLYSYVELVKALEINGFSGVRSVDITEPTDIVLNYEDRIMVELGFPENLEYKLKFSKFIIDEKLTDTDKGTINARINVAGQASYIPSVS